ncbi:hypothetical protein [Rhodococcus sp. BH5]|uniref:hypothetical protein n=1 Tax=Rhodococcus sp. BH5 TaxID=2871702 RepID=UPI0022CD3825|nr:hypothetical protein [Rhodococcus sp. BH5]MCZ9633225.1 hypothetical protein [Rhodococcus sp. BH5]
MTATAWAAIAAWVTLIIGVAALIFASRQVREARALREEQAAPYVVAYMEVSNRSFAVIDFVIKNLGTTAAYDIKVKFLPLPVRVSNGETVDFPYPAEMPFLAPGQEWRAAWDFGPTRNAASLHEIYDVTIDFKNSKRKDMDPSSSRLDWALIWHQVAPNPKRISHIVGELKAMNRGMTKLTRTLEGVLAVDGDQEGSGQEPDST